jgi:hypothetical protein
VIVEVDELGVWLERRGRPSPGRPTLKGCWVVLELELPVRDMAGEVGRLEARRGIPGIGPEIPEGEATSSTWVGGVWKPFFE